MTITTGNSPKDIAAQEARGLARARAIGRPPKADADRLERVLSPVRRDMSNERGQNRAPVHFAFHASSKD
jgi:hypothetical protein